MAREQETGLQTGELDVESVATGELNLGSVYVLLGSNAYYPDHNNIIRVFASEERAESVLEDLDAVGGSEWQQEWKALKEKYEWLPRSRNEYYSVEEYEVDCER